MAKPLITSREPLQDDPRPALIDTISDLDRNALRKSGLSFLDFKCIQERGGDYQKEYVKFFRKFLYRHTNTFCVRVIYYQSHLKGLTTDYFDWADTRITLKNFPEQDLPDSDVTIELVTEGEMGSLESDNAVPKGYRGATLDELIYFARCYPGIEQEFPVIALGSVFTQKNEVRKFPCLHKYGQKCHLGLATLNPRSVVRSYYGGGIDMRYALVKLESE